MSAAPSEDRERRIIHWVVRSAVALFAVALLLYPADWLVWEVKTIFGRGTSTLEVYYATAAELKGNKEEYYSDGARKVTCSDSLFPQGGNSACWWLRRHPQIVQRY
jgi:hypothetical protein